MGETLVIVVCANRVARARVTVWRVASCETLSGVLSFTICVSSELVPHIARVCARFSPH